MEIEPRVPRDVYVAMMAEAKAAALPVGGKVPTEVTPAEASDAGQSTIDNLETIYDGVFGAAHQRDLIGGIDAFLQPAETAMGYSRRWRATSPRSRPASTRSLTP